MRSWFTRCGVVVAALALLIGQAGLVRADVIIVDVESNFFAPSDVTVSVGDTVCWMVDSGFHTTTSGSNGIPDGLWDSGFISAGSMFEYTFNDLGDFPYFCSLHFDCCDMEGIVHVVQPVELTATLTAGDPDPDATGAASFEMRPTRASFSVAVTGVTSTNALDVFINGNPVGSITLDCGGSGALLLDTQQGDTVPPLQGGVEVEVFDAADDTTLILIGTLSSAG
jgi:plastocyanin